ncbi:MAG: hypothetical protein FWC99_04075 [Coriobacteriia bacterium]|nr:hypothetical protein [Coriobacteriia bacterium]
MKERLEKILKSKRLLVIAIALFVLAAPIFTFAESPQSGASQILQEGNDNLTLRWTDSGDSDHLSLRPTEDTRQELRMILDFNSPAEARYGVGEIEIRLPRALFKNDAGNLIVGDIASSPESTEALPHMVVPLPGDTDFLYTIDSRTHEVVISNFRPVEGATRLSVEILSHYLPSQSQNGFTDEFNATAFFAPVHNLEPIESNSLSLDVALDAVSSVGVADAGSTAEAESSAAAVTDAGIAPASTSGFPIYSWGDNSNGRLGHGVTGSAGQLDVPTRVGAESNWIQSCTSTGSSFAVNAEGHLYGWGNPWTANNMGQGDNPANPGTGSINVPTRIGTASNWVQVASRGSSNVVAVNAEGHLYAWGTHNELNGNANVPTRVGAESNWTFVATQGSNAFVINDQGHLYAWGLNPNGELGQGDYNVPRSTPTRVGDRSDWAMISAGGAHLVALTTGGELFTWGLGTSGQLGVGAAVTRITEPTRVGETSTWVSVTGSTDHTTAAINSDGHLYTWGSASLGQLANGTSSGNVLAPARVGTEDNWNMVVSGARHFLAFNDDHQLFSWGGNALGQLGLGYTGGFENEPSLILQSFGFAGAARGGGSHSIMLMHTDPVSAGHTVVRKNLQMPEGTTLLSDKNFTFTFERIGLNNLPNTAALLPVIPDRVITISVASSASTTGGIITSTAPVVIFTGVEFTQAGVHEYIIRETANSSGTNAAPNDSSMVYSQAEYRLRVDIEQPDGIGGSLYLGDITIHRITDTAGDPVIPAVEVDYPSFTNQYTRTTGGTDDYPGALALEKEVVGQFANPSTIFNFDITLNRTALCPPTTAFIGRVYNPNGTFVRTESFVSGTQRTVPLLDGQRIVFGDTRFGGNTSDELVVGTVFDFTEQAAEEFTASAVLYVDGLPVTIAPNTNPNTPLPLGQRFVGDDRNTADFINTHIVGPPDTGLSISGVPMLMLAAPVVLLVTYFTFKARRRLEGSRLQARNNVTL